MLKRERILLDALAWKLDALEIEFPEKQKGKLTRMICGNACVNLVEIILSIQNERIVGASSFGIKPSKDFTIEFDKLCKKYL